MKRSQKNPQASTPSAKSSRFEEKRVAILDAAARQFNERGVNGAALVDIASSVGLVTSGITYYFRKKEDLAAACLLTSIAEAKALVLAAAEEPTLPRRVERLFALHAAQLAAIERGERPALIGFSDTRSLPDVQAATVFEAYVELFRCLRTLLTGPEAPTLSRDARNARTHLLLSVLNSVAGWTTRCEPSQYARLGARVANVVLHGVIDSAKADSAAAKPPLAEPAPAADETAEAFLRAATELVNEQGYRGASVDKIAALLNATKGKFYYYNETKIDLVTACFERSFEVQRHFLMCAEQAIGSSADRIVAAATALIRFQLSERGPLLRGSGFSALPDQKQRQVVFYTMERVIERMGNLVVDGLVDGSVRPQDPAISSEVLYAAINAAAELKHWVPGIGADSANRLYTRPSLLGLMCDE
ncbi:MAG: TetR/AcrR family transcriptional regulator [Betaproteobacteria bacterium]